MNAATSAPERTVWSIGVRLLHWTLALSMITSFVTSEGGDALQSVHEAAGYVALAAASLRVVMGLLGRGYWRFTQFLRNLPQTMVYARTVLSHRDRRYLGHNPLGGWMVVALLADTIAAGLTGWLYTTDRFWGVKWLGELHEAFGEAFMPLLLLHLAGVAFTSWRHRENLVAAMLHGRKREAGPGDIS